MKHRDTRKREPLVPRLARGLFATLGGRLPGPLSWLALKLWSKTRRFPRSAGERRALARAEADFVPLGDCRVAVWRWPQAAQRRRGRVLLVHGWNGRGGQWYRLAEALHGAGYEAVVFDAPGHGASDGGSSSLFRFADAITALARRDAPFDAVVTHSFGIFPASLTSGSTRPRRVVAIAAPSDFDRLVTRFADWMAMPERMRAAFRATIAARHGADLARRVSPPVLLRRHGAHVMVVHDRDDAIVPFACGEALAAALPDSRLLTTSGLGHGRILRDPEVVSAVVDFITAG